MTAGGITGAAVVALLQQLPRTWEGRQSALDPVSPLAARVDTLWWAMFWVSAVVYVVVVGYLLYATFARRRERVAADAAAGGAPEIPSPHAERTREPERTATRYVVVGTGITVAILFTFLLLDFFTGRANAAPAHDPNALRVELIGHQWWWEATYIAKNPQQQLSVSNEIHVPVGRPVLFTMTSRDVIHSFWVPNFTGKSDLIPGHRSATWFRADTAGVYRGQCAEFCGLQHAKMALLIIAEPKEQFDKWYGAQLNPAAVPDSAGTRGDSLRYAGQQVFLSGACSSCHAVRGTPAASRVGPDLTHVGSQLTIAAGTLPNTRGNLAGWVVDPQRIKPGTYMPPNNLKPSELEALLAYLQGLR